MNNNFIKKWAKDYSRTTKFGHNYYTLELGWTECKKEVLKILNNTPRRLDDNSFIAPNLENIIKEIEKDL